MAPLRRAEARNAGGAIRSRGGVNRTTHPHPLASYASPWRGGLSRAVRTVTRDPVRGSGCRSQPGAVRDPRRAGSGRRILHCSRRSASIKFVGQTRVQGPRLTGAFWLPSVTPESPGDDRGHEAVPSHRRCCSAVGHGPAHGHPPASVTPLGDVGRTPTSCRWPRCHAWSGRGCAAAAHGRARCARPPR